MKLQILFAERKVLGTNAANPEISSENLVSILFTIF